MGWSGRSRILLVVSVAMSALLLLAVGCGGDGTDDATDDAGGDGSAAPASQPTTYTNDEFGFSVTYDPQRFDTVDEVAEEPDFNLVLIDSSQTDGPAAIRITVGASGPDGPRFEPGSPETMEALEAQFAEFSKALPDADIGETEECTLGGLPALRVYVGGTIPGVPIDDPQLTGMIYGTAWADKGMFVLVGTPSPIWGENEAGLQEVVDSITIETGE